MFNYLQNVLVMGKVLVVLMVAVIATTEIWVKVSTRKRLYNSVQEIPKNKVGLLLGTAKYLPDGEINLYYSYRIEAAVTLLKAEKVAYILVSGDNSTKDYDEPSTFEADLVAAGVPADKIYKDYAGFRTLDSVVRSKEIFGQEAITVISQPFHNERAIFIAAQKNMEAIGYNAERVRTDYSVAIWLRERLARVKMMLDLAFGKMPKYLGKRVEIK